MYDIGLSLLHLIICTQLYQHVQCDNVQIPGNSEVNFELFTRAYLQQSANTDDFHSVFRPDLQTKIIIHGFQSDTQSDMVQSLKNNYLQSRECNVIAVVWPSKSTDYFMVANRTKDVGLVTARLIDFLHEKLGSSMGLIHIIGHSLGAHAAGFAGSLATNSVHRITGLDPAFPGFEIATTSPDNRLDQTDADFVDIIHTDGGIFGLHEPVGHVDFYPNEGIPKQPGCDYIGCSHGRSHAFFAESIVSTVGFWGHACSSWSNFLNNLCPKPTASMGDPVSSDTRGLMFLKTNDQAPFGLGFV